MDDRTANLDCVSDQAALRGLYQPPMELALLKQLDRLDPHCRNFLAHSPFCVIASTRPEKGTDVSPRGDAPGFARVLDDYTIAIPDRPGNNRLDTMSNIVADAEVGLLFFIPGIDETLRINGTARITDDARLLAPSAVKDRTPRVGLVVAIEEALLHCPKALIRSALWDASRHIDRAILPTYAQMLLDHVKGLSQEENDRQTKVMAERGLY